jgi:flagellar protein FlaG
MNMSIESISGVVQPVMVKGSELPYKDIKADGEALKTTAVRAELTLKAVKGLSPLEEEKQLEDATGKANEFLKSINQELQFSVDKETGKTVVKVTDKQTGDVIRQIPSKEMLELAKAMDKIQGLIIRKQA